MTGLYLAQLLLPLVLIGWMLWHPARSRLGFVVQSVGSFAALAAMAVRGIWLLPPWWMPNVFGAALVAAAWVGLRHSLPFRSAMPGTWGAWIVAASFVALGAVSLVGTAVALHSRTPPPLPMVHLAFPLVSPPFRNWFKPDDAKLDIHGCVFFKRNRLKRASSSLF